MDVLPDAEVVIIAWLLSLPAITDVLDNRIVTVIDRNPTWPLARVTRIGGTVDEPWRDNPTVQIDFYGGIDVVGAPNSASYDTVSQLARDAIASIDTLKGAVVAGVFVYGAYINAGPSPGYDPTSYRPRQIFEVAFEMEAV